MKLVLLAVLCCLRIPLMVSIDMLNCALGLVEDQLCPEDGGWSQWVAWGQCEGECGSVGRQVRYRNCSNPPPERNGADCEGNQLEVKPCSVPGCSYEQYDKFLAHDAVRQQELINLRKYSGPQSALLTKCLSSNCDLSDVSQALSSEQTKFWNSLICVKKNTGCPEAGGWGDWSPWTRCNARCGSGQRMRCRACCDPPPSSADVTCRGDTCEYQSCTGIECGQPLSKGGDWSQWSDWSACSSPCNFGYMRRTRVCENQPQVLSNEENSALSMSNDYNYVKDNANSEDDYSYAYYDDDLDRTDDNYEDNSHDSIDDMHSLHSRAKRSKTCDKVEYYNNAEEEDIQSTKLKSKVTTRKMERKTVEQILNEGKFTVLGQEKDSWIFKKTDSPNQGKKFYTKIETLITTTPSFGLNTGQPKTKTSKIITRNSGMNEPSNEISDRTITKIPISGEAEVTRKCTKTYPNTEKKGNRVIDPIVLDESQSDGEEKCGELYKNSSTVVPCKGGEEECGELYKNSSTAVPCKGRTNILTITANWQAIWHTGKLNHGKKCSPSMGPSSVQRLKSAKSDVTNNEIEMSSEATVINLEESYSSTALPTIIKAVKSDVSNIKIAMSSETNAVDLEPSSVQLTFKDSRTVTVKETTPIKVPISLPVTSETESVSQKISFPISSRKPTMVSNSGLGLYPTLPLASKASTEKFFRIFPTKNSTPGTDQELPTFKSTSPHVNDDVIEVIGSEKLNISSTRPTTCDLSKKLELPSFSDSFPAESCSGSFEEVKPCNTHLCDVVYRGRRVVRLVVMVPMCLRLRPRFAGLSEILYQSGASQQRFTVSG